MMRPRLVIKASWEWTRLLLTFGDQEVMRAQLPPPRPPHRRAAPTLAEGLALWLDRPLSIALCADEQRPSSALGLCDGFGFGDATEHYEVEVLDPRRRLRGLGRFGDLRHLVLRSAR